MIVDLAIVSFVGFFVWRGLRRGIVRTLTGFVGFVVAVVAAVAGYRALAVPLRALLGIGAAVSSIVAALAIFVALSVAFWFAGRALAAILRWTKWQTLDRAAGGAVSGAWALAWVATILLALSALPPSRTWERHIGSSDLARAITEATPGFLATVAATDLRDMLSLFAPDEDRVALVATTDFAPYPAAERRLFDLANRERRARRLPVLEWSEPAAEAARAHAADMYRHGYFAHLDRSGRTPAQRLRARAIAFRTNAENLGLGPSPAELHDRLMRSPRHRRVILGARYRVVGIGALYGRQGLLVAEEFIG